MDKDSVYIYKILANSEKPLTTSEISKSIYEKFGVKISRKITQNYLWSYFRGYITYNAEDFTYKITDSKLTNQNVKVNETSNSIRPINTYIKDAQVQIDFDKSIPIDIYIKAIAILNFRKVKPNGKNDLIKELNRTIENLKLIDTNEFS